MERSCAFRPSACRKPRAYVVQDRFIRDLLAAVAPENRKYLVGAQSQTLEASSQAKSGPSL
jgi:hypothetical protein